MYRCQYMSLNFETSIVARATVQNFDNPWRHCQCPTSRPSVVLVWGSRNSRHPRRSRQFLAQYATRSFPQKCQFYNCSLPYLSILTPVEMSDKKSKASWMFSQKTRDAAEERERKQREYRLGSDNFTWEDISEEDSEEEAKLDEDADSRAARAADEAAPPVAALPQKRTPTRCFDWMFSSTAKDARKRREEEAALKRQRKTTEVKPADDDDSEESDADFQAALYQSIQKEPKEVTHVRVQQPEHNVVDKLVIDEAQNVPTNTPVNDKDSVGEAALAEEPTPEIPDDEEDEVFQRAIMESLKQQKQQQQQQQQEINPQHAKELLKRFPEIARINPLESGELSEGEAKSGHEIKASLKPEPMETSIEQEQRPDGDDIEKNNGDAEENAPKNEDSSKPESKDAQLEATVGTGENTESLIDECIGTMLAGKEAEIDTSAIISEDDMLGSSQESLYESDTEDEANEEDKDDGKHSEEEEKHVEQK